MSFMAEHRVRAADTSSENQEWLPGLGYSFATRPAQAGLPDTRMITPVSVACLFRFGSSKSERSRL